MMSTSRPRKPATLRAALEVTPKDAHRGVLLVSDEAIHDAIEHVGIALDALGLDTTAEGLKDTPKRFVKYLLEFMQPIDATLLTSQWSVENKEHVDGILVQRNIPFRAICEHHLLPMFGVAHVGYIPNDSVVGLSKLARLVDAVGTSRPWIQEAITEAIANLLKNELKPKGVMVVTNAQHMCMGCRGVNTPGVETIFSKATGQFLMNPSAREEFFHLIKG